jgi:tetraprenyl-beta-curcumene synthase
VSALADRRLTLRAARALLLASIRYRLTVAPIVRAELARWARRADAIPDPDVRTLALSKLRQESFNAEAGAMLATFARRKHRSEVVQAIVALELLFDLLDGLTERPLADPLGDARLLFAPFIAALESDQHDGGPASAAGGYLRELSAAAREAVARLPAAAVVLPFARVDAGRAAQAQIRMHAVPALGAEQLREWAEEQADGTGLDWRAQLAGAASAVLAVHALLATAADPHTTPEQAAQLDRAYLPICLVLTLLDSLVDEAEDLRSGELSYHLLWEDRDLLSDTLVDAVRRAVVQARELPAGAQHITILTGVVAYYATAPGASREPASSIVRELQRELRPLIGPTLLLMRSWRLARRARLRLR